jgi:Protein of unknown function (DUF2934)
MATTKSTTAKKTTPKPAAKKTTVTGKATAKTVTTKKPAPKASTPATAKKPAAPAKASPAKPAAPSPEQRYKMVQDAAYFIAEKNGFKAGSMDYWIAAEVEITALLSGKKK